MDNLFEAGVQIIIWLQNLGTWLVAPMKAFSMLGNEEFYLLVAPALIWCLDTGIGLRAGMFLMVNNSINMAIKLISHAPRPYWYDSRIVGRTMESSFSFPSGHAQNASAVWGALAYGIRRRWAWILAMIVIFLIGLSRSVLGVHFAHDVVGGWLIGALVLWGLVMLEKPILRWLQQLHFPSQLLAAFTASLALILLATLARLTVADWVLPVAWVENATAAFPKEEVIQPVEISGVVSNAGAFFGLAAGALWLRKSGNDFQMRGSPLQLAARYLVGIIGVFALWYGLGLVFPRGESLLPYLLRYLRYGLVGLWITGLAPLIFVHARLAERK
ncbi:MAG: phosphatase PAP2 family protein [Anaerolineales bacterium]|nr:phosphatase PAP2 family protein [Anaerolineales bacterium]